MAIITALNVYPVKSCRGIPRQQAHILETGIEHDREWMIVKPGGQFVTQRELPRLALIETALTPTGLRLTSPQAGALDVAFDQEGAPTEVVCWRDRCAAFDAGDHAASWLEAHLGEPHRLVRFDRRRNRYADTQWTQGIDAITQFADGFPFLLISQASLDDLNSRLPQPLPMNRFRPNIVVEGLPAYGEDATHELRTDAVTLRIVKPCTRCAITTTDQATATRDGDEPLRTLRSYRFSRELKGVMFGQNMILVRGADTTLSVGESFEVDLRS
jgi:uncharacterized protein YcbX